MQQSRASEPRPTTARSTEVGAWRRLPLERIDAGRALARAEELLDDVERAGSPVLAWSTVESPALVLGRAAHEPALDWREVERQGVGVHRRASGGGAVRWDEGLLGLDVALPPEHPRVSRDVVETYAWLGEAFALGLSDLGLDDVQVVSVAVARAQPKPEGLLALACYGSLSPYEVTITGRKVLGLSQVRRKHGTLLQAGLLLDHDAPGLARLLGRSFEATELQRVVTTVRQHAPSLTGAEVVAALERRIGSAL